MNMSTFSHDLEWLTTSPPPAPSEVEIPWVTTSPPPADWELKPLVVDAPTPPDELTPTETSTSHTIILESPASPTPSDDDSKLAAPLEGECDPESVGYGVTTSPSTSDTDSLPELRAVSALPKASASMSGPISPTHQRHVGPGLRMMTTMTSTVAWWTTARMLSSATSDV